MWQRISLTFVQHFTFVNSEWWFIFSFPLHKKLPWPNSYVEQFLEGDIMKHTKLASINSFLVWIGTHAVRKPACSS